ncbi:MAG: SIMPL domain-containing protein [Desulfarculaceae bacterium]|nr:SIMPL domain-containing protein [Desulfarculaceae bacterium]MCF8065029.1 SIMPL domain-containing protein [Desulfarculaceae bacterium]MCF8098304.1 SIMPL domain-containing protein [Desulfarculaceae bacterium]MCF8123335.1 SIMPL domain-containing protein [Desulfarculaceae bacterium]
MRRWLIFTMVLLGLWLPCVALAQDSVPSIIVDGQATLRLTPEEGVITVGVITEALTAAQASEANAATMQKVVAALKKMLGDKGRLETAGYWLRPLTTWDKENKRNITTGYKASHDVRVTSRDPLALAGLLDTAVAAGANTVSGPDWQLADSKAAGRRALAAAFADAKARAQVLARAAGMRLGPVLKIRVSGAVDSAPMLNRAMAKAMAATPLQPNEVQVRAEVNCVFALLPAAPGVAE